MKRCSSLVAKTTKRAGNARLTAKAVTTNRGGLNLFWFTHEPAWEIGAPRKFLFEPIWTAAGGESALFQVPQWRWKLRTDHAQEGEGCPVCSIGRTLVAQNQQSTDS